MLGNDVQTSSTTADGGDDEAEPKPSSAGKWSDLIEALTKANQSGNEYISTILGSRAQMEAFCSDAAKKHKTTLSSFLTVTTSAAIRAGKGLSDEDKQRAEEGIQLASELVGSLRVLAELEPFVVASLQTGDINDYGWCYTSLAPFLTTLRNAALPVDESMFIEMGILRCAKSFATSGDYGIFANTLRLARDAQMKELGFAIYNLPEPRRATFQHIAVVVVATDVLKTVSNMKKYEELIESLAKMEP
jgi:hypothetical protein